MMAVGALVAVLFGCAPVDREAAQRAWEARDLERARECLQQGGQWVGGGTCTYGRGP
jgi:hypothetical protein